MDIELFIIFSTLCIISIVLLAIIIGNLFDDCNAQPENKDDAEYQNMINVIQSLNRINKKQFSLCNNGKQLNSVMLRLRNKGFDVKSNGQFTTIKW